jgi:2,3,4,5-tetrahydropyridine-2-carboxylate N-succinyltransferase
MSWTNLQIVIDEAWEARDTISPATHGPARKAIEETLAALDCGEFRVAEKSGGEWHRISGSRRRSYFPSV